MKKLILFAVFLLLIPIVALNCHAENSESDEQINSSGIYEQYDKLQSETKEILSSLGLDEISTESIFNISFESFLHSFSEVFKNKLSSVLKSFFVLLCIVFIGALSISLDEGILNSKTSSIFNLCACLAVITIALKPLEASISSVGSAVSAASAFTVAAMPIGCALLAAQGKVISSNVFNAGAVFLSQAISALSVHFFLPVFNMLLGVGMLASMDTDFAVDKIISTIRKYLSVAYSFLATVFFAVLSIKSNIGVSADEVGIKAIKVVTGNFVPIIGNAISDSASAVIGSLSLTKNVISGFGIAALTAIFFPCFCESVLWFMALNGAEILSEALNVNTLAKIFRNMSQALLVMIIILVLSALMFIINFGMLMSVKGTA